MAETRKFDPDGNPVAVVTGTVSGSGLGNPTGGPMYRRPDGSFAPGEPAEEVTPEMMAAGVKVLHESGKLTHPAMGPDQLTVAEIYRAMRAARRG